MESEDHQPAPEKPTDGDEQSAYQAITRSYECNFCKRGFSNAQALGGHMNIHRKDKAKLKQSHSNQTQPSLDVHHNVPPLWPVEGKPGEERSNLNLPWHVSQQDHASSRDETHVIVRTRQLPLFAESPTTISSEAHNPEGQVRREITAERALPSGQGSSSELDLELRLGPEPQDPSAATGTRKFLSSMHNT